MYKAKLGFVGFCCMRCRQLRKSGYTLVEVLVVVTIMGILSSLGVAGLNAAVQNNRIKDAGINVTAYMERAANEANKMSSSLCVVASGNTIKTFEKACPTGSGTSGDANVADLSGDPIDKMELESANHFVTPSTVPSGCTAVFASSGITLTPRLGLSAVPTGCFVIQYGSSDRYAAAIKTASKNTTFYRLSYDGGSSWTD